MACAEQQRLLSDEAASWAAYNYLKDSGSKDQNELSRRSNNASDASTRLRCPSHDLI